MTTTLASHNRSNSTQSVGGRKDEWPLNVFGFRWICARDVALAAVGGYNLFNTGRQKRNLGR